MSGQNYYGGNHDSSYQGHNQSQQYGHGYDTTPSHDGQYQQYQSHPQQGYSQDNEPVNWGYGGDPHQSQYQQTSHDYYGSNTNVGHEASAYPSYDHNQANTYDQGYNQPQQNYTQHQDTYPTHDTHDRGHSPQPPQYGTNASDYTHQTQAGTYSTTHYAEHNYQTQDPTHQQQFPGAAPVPAEGERGLLGAIGGAVAGGYAGHKVNHGFIGTIGGAYAGHKLEEALKDKKKKEKKEKQGKYGSYGGRRGSSSSSSSSSDDEKKKKKKYGTGAAALGVAGAAGLGSQMYHGRDSQYGHHGAAVVGGGAGGHQGLAGNFSSSCTQISLDRDYDLIASCATTHGDRKLSSISLNGCLTNSWGQLQWARGGGFAGSSRNVKLVDGGKVLEAELGDGKGGWHVSRIRLDERITNRDGDLQFLG